jgi:serine/threonine protein kinase/WD40 repeat protein
MSAPASTTEFLTILRKSGLVDEAKFSELFPDENDLPSDATSCANRLTSRGLLTKYQAKMLLAGKSRGFLVGPYVIQTPIGHGGMGIVYLARHASLDRQVALKVLSTDRAKEQISLDRFLREARAAAALDHPNIVRLYDIGQGAGVHYLVMELVEGTNLQEMVSKTGPLHYVQAAQYIAQAAAGLHHAHEKGFVHRDIKPGNLMVTKAGSIKILDMGLARSVTDSKDNLTAQLGDGEILGTPDYIAPEQLLGEQADARTDIYSLGATLFALLSGYPPFTGTTTQKMAQHQLQDPNILLKKLRGKAPPEMGDVIIKMMAKRKIDRYQSAEDVIDALTPWLPADSPGSVTGNIMRSSAPATMRRGLPPLEPKSGTRRKKKRREKPAAKWEKWLIIGGSSVGVLVMIGLVGLIAALMGDKDQANANGGGSSGEQAAGVRPPDAQVLKGHPNSINDLTYRSDGRIASVDWSGNLIVWDSKTGQTIHSTALYPGASFKCVASTPDGKRLVIGGSKCPILVVEWDNGRKIGEIPGHGDTTWGLAVSPSGRELLSCGSDGVVLLRDLNTAQEIRRFEFDSKTVWSCAFSADGSKIAASCAKGSTDDESNLIRIWDTASGAELARLTGHTRDVRWVTFAPNGKTLASAGFDGTVRLWDIANRKQIRSITAHKDGYAERVFFLSGDQQLVSCGGNTNGQNGSLAVWNAGNGKEIRAWLGGGANGLISLAVSPNGTQFASGSRDKTVRLWKRAD